MSFPTTPVPSTISIRSITPTFTSVTQSLKRQVRQRGGQRWLISASYPPLNRTEFAPVWAFAQLQKGQFNTFTFIPPVYGNTSGTATGTLLVNNSGGYAVGTTTIVSDGLTGTLKAGDFLKFAGHDKVYTLTADSGTSYPAFIDASSNIQAMSQTDILDTFIHPAIDLLTAGTTTSQQAGTYHISNASSVSGSTLVSATPVFSDTRANTASFSAGNIGTSGTTQDFPTTINNYYLHRIDGSDTSYTLPIFVRASDNHLQVFPEADFETMVKNIIDYTAVSSTDGYSISYNVGTSGSGVTRGSGMANTILNGSGNRQTRFVNANDYRAQEFPNGTAVTSATYYLRINKS